MPEKTNKTRKVRQNKKTRKNTKSQTNKKRTNTSKRRRNKSLRHGGTSLICNFDGAKMKYNGIVRRLINNKSNSNDARADYMKKNKIEHAHELENHVQGNTQIPLENEYECPKCSRKKYFLTNVIQSFMEGVDFGPLTRQESRRISPTKSKNQTKRNS